MISFLCLLSKDNNGGYLKLHSNLTRWVLYLYFRLTRLRYCIFISITSSHPSKIALYLPLSKQGSIVATTLSKQGSSIVASTILHVRREVVLSQFYSSHYHLLSCINGVRSTYVRSFVLYLIFRRSSFMVRMTRFPPPLFRISIRILYWLASASVKCPLFLLLGVWLVRQTSCGKFVPIIL